ncbi:hypothetical protein [Sphingobacterium chungjuense]|uniref:hypothetical protein n=1 Tax=Sphingobacterium chungjuense TaxID=2675553 RepID=UPI00140CBD86|nr:hypothetical protein [Sphingobacterium chungjuense]
MKDKKKSKYIAPNIQVDAIATEHWIAAHSENVRQPKTSAPIKREDNKSKDTGDGESW